MVFVDQYFKKNPHPNQKDQFLHQILQEPIIIKEKKQKHWQAIFGNKILRQIQAEFRSLVSLFFQFFFFSVC